MRSAIIGTGVILMLVGVGLLMLIIVIPVTSLGQGNPLFMNTLSVLVCKPGERFVQDFHTVSDLRGTVTGGLVYCVDNENQKTEVTDLLVQRALVAFFVPFIVGLLMSILGSELIPKRRTPLVYNSGTTAFGGIEPFSGTTSFITGSGRKIEIQNGVLTVNGVEIPTGYHGIDEQFEVLRQMKPVRQNTSGAKSLTEKLRQIQDARDKGLISSEEYDRLRQHTMDEAL